MCVLSTLEVSLNAGSPLSTLYTELAKPHCQTVIYFKETNKTVKEHQVSEDVLQHVLLKELLQTKFRTFHYCKILTQATLFMT